MTCSMCTELMKTLLKGGRVIDPANGRDGDVRHSRSKTASIARIGKDLPVDGADVFEVRRGWIVAPGLDRHSRPPARAGAGTQGNDRDRRPPRRSPAASRPSPACRTPSRSTITPGITEFILKKAAEAGRARVYPIGAVSIGSRGDQLAELGEQKTAGCVAFTDDGRPVATALLDATGARVRAHARRADRQPLRGSVAERRRRRARRVTSRRISGCAAFLAKPSRSWSSATFRWPSSPAHTCTSRT